LAKKSELLELASHYKVTSVRTAMRKNEIRDILVQDLVDDGIFDEEFMTLIEGGSDQRFKMKLELEKFKLERELEAQERERDRQFQIKMKELELGKTTPVVSKTFDVTRNIRLVPPFQEKGVDKYFLHFKKVAENLKWPKEHWPLLLQSVLIGKARDIYT